MISNFLRFENSRKFEGRKEAQSVKCEQSLWQVSLKKRDKFKKNLLTFQCVKINTNYKMLLSKCLTLKSAGRRATDGSSSKIWVCNQYIVKSKSKWKFLNLVIWIEFYALSHNLALLKLNNDFKFNIFKC